MPRVSVCVPNLNCRPFLPERFQTIFDQAFQDWELLVYDSYSDDGAWEYIRELADREPRMRVWQGPREGTPGSWSPCVRAATGEYVYIATSDDTMPPDCLEKLVAALDDNPQCDIAHCRLRAIDEHGRDITPICEGWAQESMFAESSGQLLDMPHVRKAPFDGMLHLLGASVYISITQLLVRRSLFDRIGFFASTWGSVGDFDWVMRAGLVADTVHVPNTWGGWRVHGSQATAGVKMISVEHARKIDAMIDDAIETSRPFLSPNLYQPLASRWSAEARQYRAFIREADRRGHSSAARRRAFVVQRMLAGSAPAWRYVQSRLLGRSFADWVRSRLAEAGVGPALIPIAATTPNGSRTTLAIQGHS